MELDALYRHLSYRDSYAAPVPGTVINEHVTSGAWEFPLLLKYRFTERVTAPYVSAGPACDVLALKNSFVSQSPGAATSGSDSSPLALQHTAIAGFSAGIGLELRAAMLHISPEIRYTRWVSPHFSTFGLTDSKQNQAEFLLGFTF